MVGRINIVQGPRRSFMTPSSQLTSSRFTNAITRYVNWARFAVLGILPFGAITFLNTKIYVAVRFGQIIYRYIARINIYLRCCQVWTKYLAQIERTKFLFTSGKLKRASCQDWYVRIKVQTWLRCNKCNLWMSFFNRGLSFWLRGFVFPIKTKVNIFTCIDKLLTLDTVTNGHHWIGQVKSS